MRDIRPAYWIGLPVGSFLLFMAVAMASPATYATYIRKHESGVQEHGTVILLVPAMVLGVMVFRRRHELPKAWLGWWWMMITLGALFFGGEECSWGQNYFNWATPEGWSDINRQHETNLHNTSNLFNHVPRAALNAATMMCVVAPFVLARQRRHWNAKSNPWAWFWPTTAIVPTAAVAILSGLPQKFHGTYEKDLGTAHTWYGEMFLNGRHSEMKEFYFAMFMLIYMWSFATRLSSLRASDSHTNEHESAGAIQQGPHAGPTGRQAAAA